MGKPNIRKFGKYKLVLGVSYSLIMIAAITFTVSYVNNKVSPAKTKPATSSAAASCTISATLVNSCRPWLGAAVDGYANGSLRAEIANHEGRIGRQLDVVHDYRSYSASGAVLSADDVFYAKRANTILMVNWKPAQPWSAGDGSNATINANIDKMANSIKALGATKIMLTVYHEPENNVNQGASACGDLGPPKDGATGTPADYVAMWHNVRARFDKLGVSNVIWVMNYMGAAKWNCMVNQLYPGDAYVDWITWDPYAPGGGMNITNAVNVLYSFLTNNSDASKGRNYLSKTWGINEWGVDFTDAATSARQYDTVLKGDVDNNTFPKIKLWDVWDNSFTGNSGCCKVYYDNNGSPDPAKQAAYNKFANDAHFFDSSTPIPSPNPAPTISAVSPANGPAAGGTSVTISGNNFTNGAVVTFGGVAGTAVSVKSATNITVTTPAHPAGPLDVVVKNPDGQTATKANGYTYMTPVDGGPGGGGTPSFTTCSGPTSSTNLALNRPVEVSSVQSNNTTLVGCRAVDGSIAFGSTDANDSRWSSVYSDPQWLTVDLGSSKAIGSVSINWEYASAKNYQVQVSSDNSHWNTVSTVTGNGTGSTATNPTAGVKTYSYSNISGRYVRIYGTARTTQYGYSIIELNVQPPGTVVSAPPPVTVTGGKGSDSGSVVIPAPGSGIGSNTKQPVGSDNPLTLGVSDGEQVQVPANAVPIIKGDVVIGNPRGNTQKGTITKLTVDGVTIAQSSGDTIALDTHYLTNGVHQVIITTKLADGTTEVTARNVIVSNKLNIFEQVRNPLYLPLRGNKLAANTAAGVSLFQVGGSGIVGVYLLIRHFI